MGGTWVFSVKVINSIGRVIEVIPVFPGVFFNTITFPFDQVLQFTSEHVAINGNTHVTWHVGMSSCGQCHHNVFIILITFLCHC